MLLSNISACSRHRRSRHPLNYRYDAWENHEASRQRVYALKKKCRPHRKAGNSCTKYHDLFWLGKYVSIDRLVVS